MAGQDNYEKNGLRVTRRKERCERAAIYQQILSYYDLQIRDLGGSSYLIYNSQGKTIELHNLDDIWNAAEKLSCVSCDPLETDLLNYIQKF